MLREATKGFLWIITTFLLWSVIIVLELACDVADEMSPVLRSEKA